MRFIVDESTGSSVVANLRTAGHDVLAVAEAFLQADDQDILTRAMSEKRVLITNDKDFGDLIFRSGQTHHGVVLSRLRDERAANRVRVVRNLLERYADRLPDHFTVVTEAGVRLRANLPSS